MRGASKGEGLGNQFLANIRECDAIAHVVRCFEDDDITHVEGKIAPLDDIETVETELMLADLDSLEKRAPALEKKAKGGDKEAKETSDLVERAVSRCCARASRRGSRRSSRRSARPSICSACSPPSRFSMSAMSRRRGADTGNAYSDEGEGAGGGRGRGRVVVSAAIESEIALLPGEEQKDYLEAVGLEEPGLNRVIRAGYALLRLITYLHCRPQGNPRLDDPEGTKAPQAAGVIHTDFEKGFIRAETIAFDDYVAANGEAGAREAGKFRLEGKDYVVADGDVLHFRFAN